MNNNVTKVLPLLKTEMAKVLVAVEEIKRAQHERARRAAYQMSEQARLRRLASMAAQSCR